MDDRRELGRFGEDFAAFYMERCLGWRMVVRNWRCRAGELDLIAASKTHLVITEVRTRRYTLQGEAILAFSPAKQRQLKRVMPYFLRDFGWSEERVRVDVVALGVEAWKVVELTHVRGIWL